MQNADPFARLIRHLRLMGHALTALCLAWVMVVSVSLVFQLAPAQMHNHRSPDVKARIAQCTGEFSERYDCSEGILLSGEGIDVTSLVLRLAVTSLLPGTAWLMWSAAMRRTERMCAVVAARIAMEQRRIDREHRRHHQSILPA